MDTDYIDNLIWSDLHEELSEEDKQKLLDWMQASEENTRRYAETKAVAHRLKMMRRLTREEFLSALSRLHRTIGTGKTHRRRWIRAAGYAAAACAAVLAIGIVVMKATGGVCTYDTLDGVSRTLTLADGSKVWLSPQSTLSCNPRTFLRKRSVTLDGEATFDVTHSHEHPFVVNSPKINVRVLGTAFKIHDFSGESQAEATLAEGSVELLNGRGEGMLRLTPGQKATFADGSLRVEEVDSEELLLMRYGVVSIVNAPIHTILRRLEADFGVHLKVVSYEPTDSLFTINYLHESSIDDVLEMLDAVSGVRAEVDTE